MNLHEVRDGDASDWLKKFSEVKPWCIARFVEGQSKGFVLRFAGTASENFGNLGWTENAEIIWFDTKAQAEKCISELPKYKIAKDTAISSDLITYRVLLFSHYDRSCALLYDGNNWSEAKSKYIHGLHIATKSNYLKTIFEAEADKPSIRELNTHEKEFEKMGYKIDSSLPECKEHCSQMMLNRQGQPECVICTGNELAFVLVGLQK